MIEIPGESKFDQCGHTGKLRYATKLEAKSELARYARAKGSRRLYRCVFCEGYHLTKGERGAKRGSK